MNIEFLVILIIAIGVVVYLFIRNKPSAKNGFSPEMEALINAACGGWIEMRKQREVNSTEELAAQIEIHAQAFAAWAARKSGTNQLPPADRVWMIVLEAVRRSGTETSDQFAKAVELVQARNKG